MAIIFPYSDSTKYSSGGPWEATSANFPAVKHFWKCSETSGTTLTDSINGVILSGASTMTFGTNYVVPNRASGAGSTKTGTISPPAGKPFLFMAVGAFGDTSSSQGVVLGDAVTGPCLSLAQTGRGVLDATGNDYPGTAMTNGGSTVYGRGLLVTNYNSATGMQTLEATGSATYTAKAATTTADSTPSTTIPLATDGISSLNGSSAKWSCSSQVTALYGMALFIFTSAPSASLVQTLMVWHTYQWSNGNKWLYPGLKGIS